VVQYARGDKMRRFFRWLTNILLGLLVLLTVLFVLLPAVFTASLAVVYSGSMEPAMPTGAIAVMVPVDPADIRIGDIIAFDPTWDDSEVTISHRVIDIVKEPSLGFVTKGDANEDPDADVAPPDSIVARVIFNIPRLGYILGYAQRYTNSRLGFSLLIVLPTILLIGNAVRDVYYMSNPWKRRQRERKRTLERLRKRMSHA
jgi:signal peptidase